MIIIYCSNERFIEEYRSQSQKINDLFLEKEYNLGKINILNAQNIEQDTITKLTNRNIEIDMNIEEAKRNLESIGHIINQTY